MSTFTPAVSLNVLISILRKKGLCTDKANHFLRLELFNTTYHDRAVIREYCENGLSENDAALKILLIKKQYLYDKLTAGCYDQRLTFY